MKTNFAYSHVYQSYFFLLFILSPLALPAFFFLENLKGKPNLRLFHLEVLQCDSFTSKGSCHDDTPQRATVISTFRGSVLL